MIKDMLKLRAMCGGGSGSGLPEGGEPYSQLVTDGEGKTVWEDRLAYISPAETVVMPEQTVNIKATTYIGYCNDEPMQPMLFGNSDGSKGDIKIGRTYILTIDGVEYKCVAKYGVNWSAATSVFFGNASIGTDENDDIEDTGEPFLFAPTYIDQVYTLLMRREDIGEHTISLREEIVTTKYIDAALLASESGVNKMLVTDAAGATKWENKPTQEALSPLIAQTTVNMELDSDNGMCFAQIADVAPKLARDVKYKVRFAGMDYECEASIDQGILYLGSHPASIQQGVANPPFCMAEEMEGTLSIYATEEYSGEKDFALYEEVHKIDPKYLPEGVGGGAQSNQLVIHNEYEQPRKANMTYAEIVDALYGGKPLYGAIVESVASDSSGVTIYPITGIAHFSGAEIPYIEIRHFDTFVMQEGSIYMTEDNAFSGMKPGGGGLS